jgi:hypothetical protein
VASSAVAPEPGVLCWAGQLAGPNGGIVELVQTIILQVPDIELEIERATNAKMTPSKAYFKYSLNCKFISTSLSLYKIY